MLVGGESVCIWEGVVGYGNSAVSLKLLCKIKAIKKLKIIIKISEGAKGRNIKLSLDISHQNSVSETV